MDDYIEVVLLRREERKGWEKPTLYTNLWRASRGNDCPRMKTRLPCNTVTDKDVQR
jgi:hypothetical protein